VNDLQKGNRPSNAYAHAATADQSQNALKKYSQETQKYQNYQKVLSERHPVNESNYRPGSQGRQPNAGNAVEGFNPTASQANHKAKQDADAGGLSPTRRGQRNSHDAHGQARTQGLGSSDRYSGKQEAESPATAGNQTSQHARSDQTQKEKENVKISQVENNSPSFKNGHKQTDSS